MTNVTAETGSTSIEPSRSPWPSSPINGVSNDIMAIPEASAGARLEWRVARVVDIRDETPRVRTLVLDLPQWRGHRAGQHVDVRLVAEDGYQAQRSYSIASAPDDRTVSLTVERPASFSAPLRSGLPNALRRRDSARRRTSRGHRGA